MFENGVKRTRLAAVATATLAIVLLAGCASATDASPTMQPTASPAPTESALVPTPEPSSGTPTATPVEVNLDDPSSWIIDFAGIGPLTIGGDIAAEKPSMTAFSNMTYEECPPIAFFNKSEYPSIYVVTNPDSGLIQHIALVRGESSSSSPRTSRGIGIGSSLDELTAAYPELISQNVQGRLTYSLAGDEGTWINFDATDGDVLHIDVSTSSVIPKEYCG